MNTQDLTTIVQKYAKQNGVDPEILLKLIAAESSGDPQALSPVGAQGLMQLMPATAQEYGVEDPFDPDQNVRGGTEHFASLLKLYGGDVRKALAAHNWGQGNLAKGGPWPQETVNFVNRVAGPEPSPIPAPFDPSQVDSTPAPIATPIPRQGPTYEKVTSDPSFHGRSPEEQSEILNRLVGPEAAMQWAKASGPMIGPATTPMAPDLPSISDAGSRVLAWLGLNKSAEALPTGPGSINTDKYPVEETLAERPLGEGDVAQVGRGLLATAMAGLGPQALSGLAAGTVGSASIPLATKNILATLGLGSVGAGVGATAGGALGEKIGYPELGKLGGEVLGMFGGGVAGSAIAPPAPTANTAGVSQDLAGRVLDAIMSKRMKITAPRPDWAGYGEVPPEILEALKAKAAERTDIINRGPVRGVVTPSGEIPEVPPSAQRLVKTPQEAAVEGQIMDLVQPQAPGGPIVPATGVGGTPVPPTGGAPVMPADQAEAQNVIEMIRSHLAQANNAAPPPVAQTPEQEALAAERMKLAERGPVRGVVSVEGAPEETTVTPAVPVSQPTRGQVLPVPETPQEPRTVVTPQEAAARPTTLNLAPGEAPAVTPEVGTGPGRPAVATQPLTLPADEAEAKNFLEMLRRSIASARNEDLATESAPGSLAASGVIPTEVRSSTPEKTGAETLAASSTTTTPETVRIGNRDYKVGDLIEEGVHKGRYVTDIENGQLVGASKSKPKVIDTAAVPVQNETVASQPQEIDTDMSLAEGVPAELSMEAKAVIDQLPEAEREIIHRELERARSTDVLTGLQNKKGWIALAKTLGPEDHAVVMDMSGFSEINNTHGHKVGDVLLAVVGQKVQKHLGSDTSRFGGDEFGGVIRGKSLEEAQQMVADLEADLNSTFINIRMPDGNIKRIKPLEVHIGLAKDTEAADLASNDHRAKYGSGRRKSDPNPTPGPADTSSVPSTVEGTEGGPGRGGSSDSGQLDDSGIAKAEVSPGKAVGVTQPRLIRELGANLYSGDLGQVVVKEGLQNAVDAIPKGKAGNISVKVNTKDKTFEITDDGIGMLPDVVKNQFLDPGGSFKPEGGRGGYGIAKVALLSQAENIEVRSVAIVPKASEVKGDITRQASTESFPDWLEDRSKFHNDSQSADKDLAKADVYEQLSNMEWSSPIPSKVEIERKIDDVLENVIDKAASGEFGSLKDEDWSELVHDIHNDILEEITARTNASGPRKQESYPGMEGTKLETSLSGDGERWLNTENPMDVHTQEVSADTPTGTRIFIKLNEGASVSDWGVRGFLQNFLQKQKLSHKFEVELDGKPITRVMDFDAETGKYVEKPGTTLLKEHDMPGAKVQIWTGKNLRETDYVQIHVLNDGLPQFNTNVNLRGRAKFPQDIEVNIIPKVETTDPNYPFTPNRQQMRDAVSEYVENFVSNNLYSEGVRQEQELYKRALENKVPVPYTKVSVLETTGRVKQETLKEVAESGEIQRIALLTAQIVRKAANSILRSPLEVGKGQREAFRPNIFSTDLGYSGGKWYGVNLDTGRIYGKIDPATGDLTRTQQKQFSILVDPWSIIKLVDHTLPVKDQAEIFGRETWATAVHELMHNQYRQHDEDFSNWLTHWLPHTIKEGSSLIRSFRKEAQDDPLFFDKLRGQSDRLGEEFANAKGEDVLGAITVKSKSGDGQHRGRDLEGGAGGGVSEGSPRGGAGGVEGEGERPAAEATGTDTGTEPTVKRAADFKETGNYEVTVDGKTHLMYRDPESKWWELDNSSDLIPQTSKERPYYISRTLGFNKADAIQKIVDLSAKKAVSEDTRIAKSEVITGPEREANFKKWFEDSKIVDSSGKPLPVYHATGTPENFNEFRSAKSGIWFTSDAEHASLNYGYDPAGGTEPSTRLYKVFLKMKNPFIFEEDEMPPEFYRDHTLWAEKEFAKLKEKGYDGLIAKPYYAVFEPSQIKSATGNIGTFNPEDTGIAKSEVPPEGLKKAELPQGESVRDRINKFLGVKSKEEKPGMSRREFLGKSSVAAAGMAIPGKGFTEAIATTTKQAVPVIAEANSVIAAIKALLSTPEKLIDSNEIITDLTKRLHGKYDNKTKESIPSLEQTLKIIANQDIPIPENLVSELTNARISLFNAERVVKDWKNADLWIKDLDRLWLIPDKLQEAGVPEAIIVAAKKDLVPLTKGIFRKDPASAMKKALTKVYGSYNKFSNLLNSHGDSSNEETSPEFKSLKAIYDSLHAFQFTGDSSFAYDDWISNRARASIQGYSKKGYDEERIALKSKFPTLPQPRYAKFPEREIEILKEYKSKKKEVKEIVKKVQKFLDVATGKPVEGDVQLKKGVFIKQLDPEDYAQEEFKSKYENLSDQEEQRLADLRKRVIHNQGQYTPEEAKEYNNLDFRKNTLINNRGKERKQWVESKETPTHELVINGDSLYVTRHSDTGISYWTYHPEAAKFLGDPGLAKVKFQNRDAMVRVAESILKNLPKKTEESDFDPWNAYLKNMENDAETPVLPETPPDKITDETASDKTPEKVLKPGVALKPNEVFKRLLKEFTVPELKSYFGTLTGDTTPDEGQFEKIDAKIHKIFSDEEQTAWQEFLSFPENFSEKGDENLDLYKLFVKYLKTNPASTLRLKPPSSGPETSR